MFTYCNRKIWISRNLLCLTRHYYTGVGRKLQNIVPPEALDPISGGGPMQSCSTLKCPIAPCNDPVQACSSLKGPAHFHIPLNKMCSYRCLVFVVCKALGQFCRHVSSFWFFFQHSPNISPKPPTNFPTPQTSETSHAHLLLFTNIQVCLNGNGT